MISVRSEGRHQRLVLSIRKHRLKGSVIMQMSNYDVTAGAFTDQHMSKDAAG